MPEAPPVTMYVRPSGPRHNASGLFAPGGTGADSDTCSSPGIPRVFVSPGSPRHERALFYEIPVPRPWDEDSELVAYQNTLEQAIAGDRFGWHAFWTVEHHFLQECSDVRTPRCSTAPLRPGPRTSGWDTASA